METYLCGVKKQKFYVVWQGRQTGIFQRWDEAEMHVKDFPGARFKSFESLTEATEAYREGPPKFARKAGTLAAVPGKLPLMGKPIQESLSVDAACAGNPGVLEYRGVETANKRVVFSMGPFLEGTINLGEFLAIVHALALLKRHDNAMPVYSDSRTAISWVRKKEVKTNLPRTPRTAELFGLVDRALTWLRQNPYPNKILKWETEYWGENPADYGRK
ncbi:MAG: ribonuclease H family protein [Cytophagaceae bacterium]|nr:ribonuclease H family protein [Cytophagaceae bacterium]